MTCPRTTSRRGSPCTRRSSTSSRFPTRSTTPAGSSAGRSRPPTRAGPTSACRCCTTCSSTTCSPAPRTRRCGPGPTPCSRPPWTPGTRSSWPGHSPAGSPTSASPTRGRSARTGRATSPGRSRCSTTSPRATRTPSAGGPRSSPRATTSAASRTTASRCGSSRTRCTPGPWRPSTSSGTTRSARCSRSPAGSSSSTGSRRPRRWPAACSTSAPRRPRIAAGRSPSAAEIADLQPAWRTDLRAVERLLDALAADPGSAPRGVPGDLWDALGASTWQGYRGCLLLAAAVSAHLAGDDAEAAAYAERSIDHFDVYKPSFRTLAYHLASLGSEESPAARWASHLSDLRWGSRLQVLAAARARLAAERVVRHGDRLRRQALVDELTGVANRHAFSQRLPGLRGARAGPPARGGAARRRRVQGGQRRPRARRRRRGAARPRPAARRRDPPVRPRGPARRRRVRPVPRLGRRPSPAPAWSGSSSRSAGTTGTGSPRGCRSP